MNRRNRTTVLSFLTWCLGACGTNGGHLEPADAASSVDPGGIGSLPLRPGVPPTQFPAPLPSMSLDAAALPGVDVRTAAPSAADAFVLKNDATVPGTPRPGVDGLAVQPGLSRPPFVAVGYGTMRAVSVDGKRWDTAPAPTDLPAGWTGPPVSGDNQWLLRGVCFGQGKFIAVGGTGGDLGLMLSSTDGRAWTLVGTRPQANDDCAFGNGIWVTGNRYSVDGATWMRAARGASTRQMVFGGGVFVAVGDNGGGNASTTHDGKSWVDLQIKYKGTDAARKGYNNVAYGNGLFIAVHSFFQDSPVLQWDGKDPAAFTETSRMETLGEPVTIDALAYGRGMFVIASPGFQWRRLDGEKRWTKVRYTGTGRLGSLVITDTLFVTDTAHSVDGITWTKSDTPPRAVTKIVVAADP